MQDTINNCCCKHCGYKKFYHTLTPAEKIEYPVIKGYRKSIDNCPQFSLSKKDLAEIEKKEKGLKKLEQVFMEATNIRKNINDVIGKHW